MDGAVIELDSESDTEELHPKKKLKLDLPGPTASIVLSDDADDEETPEVPLPQNSDPKIQSKSNISTTISISLHRSDWKTHPISIISTTNSTSLQISHKTAENSNTDIKNGDNNLLKVLREEPLEKAECTKHETEDLLVNEDPNEAIKLDNGIDSLAIDPQPNEDQLKDINQTKEEIPAVTETIPKELQEFFDLCKSNMTKSETSEKILKIKRKFKTLNNTAESASEYLKTDEFRGELTSFHDEITKEPSKSAEVIVKLYKLLLSKENPPETEVQVTKKDVKRKIVLDDLYDKLNKVKAKIQELEVQEVDFEDENSSYIKFQKYNEKASEILAAIAKLEEHSPYAGIAYFSRLDFSRSNINEFNLVLNKKYKNRENHTFPTFYEVNKVLRACAKKKGIQISEAELTIEIECCFRELGKLLKKRRQKDLELVHFQYLKELKDPAMDDPTLNQKLKENERQGRSRMDEVIKKFTGLQETGVNPEVSEDSDDSACADSEEADDS